MRLHVDPALLTRLHAELQRRSIDMLLVETKDEARDAVLGLIPRGATIMAGSSLTLDAIGLTDRLKGGEYRYLHEGRPDASPTRSTGRARSPRFRKRAASDARGRAPTTVSVTTTTAILPSASAGKSSSSRKRMCQGASRSCS